MQQKLDIEYENLKDSDDSDDGDSQNFDDSSSVNSYEEKKEEDLKEKGVFYLYIMHMMKNTARYLERKF